MNEDFASCLPDAALPFFAAVQLGHRLLLSYSSPLTFPFTLYLLFSQPFQFYAWRPFEKGGGATILWKGNKFACPSTAWMKLIADSSCCLGTTGALT